MQEMDSLLAAEKVRFILPLLPLVTPSKNLIPPWLPYFQACSSHAQSPVTLLQLARQISSHIMSFKSMAAKTATHNQTEHYVQVLEAELVGIDSDLLQKLPPEVARQLSQRAIVTAAAQTAGSGAAASMDLLRRTTSHNSGRDSLTDQQRYAAYEDPGALGRNLSVSTSPSRRVSKAPSSVAAPSDGWRFTNDEVASQNIWQHPSESGAAAFKGLNYGSNSPAQQQPDPAGLKYATKQVQQEYRHMQEAGEEEEELQWNVHQHVAPITDSQAAEMYNKSMDWRQRNKLR